jgi:uncharacterized protein YndB with AHSA1/START domain
MMRRCLTVALLVAIAAPASAEVLDAAPNGFALKFVHDIGAPPAIVYRAITMVAKWWDPAHSFSGEPGSLSLDARAGGCFCERLPAGSVQHMLVVHADAPRRLILQGGPGPLASLGVAGAMEWVLTERAGSTHLKVTYNAGGYMPGGLAQLAPVVDGVFASQLARLKRFVEDGRPDQEFRP